MNTSIIFAVISLFIINSSLIFAEGETWQELMDSTSFYQEQQDYQTALEWAFRAEAKEQFGENVYIKPAEKTDYYEDEEPSWLKYIRVLDFSSLPDYNEEGELGGPVVVEYIYPPVREFRLGPYTHGLSDKTIERNLEILDGPDSPYRSNVYSALASTNHI